PDFPTQRFTDRGVTVNVPRGWRKAVGGVYVDFTDPQDPGRRVRILSEPSRAESTRFMEIAESGLRRAKTCAKPYARVQLRTGVTLVDRPAAELEYTCGAGEKMRHGVWRAVVSNGRAYSFYLTTPEHRFAESRGIFEEMVRSFALTAAG
ncbi:MAG TPA: serine/threonine protein kinase, partial [Pilimelia sp.]|nr:serine/threonine protein kinase [Pilimelia sp.]